jgi:tetratricopeptide (TPR) repeat protein
VITVEPFLAHAYFSRAAAWSAKGDNDRALADYSETIRIDPRYARAWAHRGLIQLQKGRAAQARSDFAEAIRLDRNLESWLGTELRKTVGEGVSRR